LLGGWAFVLFGARFECRRAMAVVVYFGLVWYGISTLPYLIEGRVTYHLYLPAVGLTIAAAFLALPLSTAPQKEPRYPRFLGMVFLVGISTLWMWKGNIEYARLGKMSARMSTQLATALAAAPTDRLVIIWPADSYLISSGWGEEILPYSGQTPFAPTDLYSRLQILEHPDMSCCGLPEWWEKTRPLLSSALAGASDGQIEIHLLSWDERSSSFQAKQLALPRERLRTSITQSLGGSIEASDSLGDEQAGKLLEALKRLVFEER
jgi:hypothetical protein